ncbi:MAG: hypothetical protein B1H08_06365 [Candidatus Omnitrophica bacterium 4484_171]|nr:MAG: hypothetical protein B1H08_06365 [Candidatus Omnitrophica bacterium 4484_171]
MYNIVIFVSGLILLIYSSGFLIQSSVKLSFLLRLAPLFIGIIIVAFGTSAPELAVGITAALKHQKAIALGNIVGSNISNIGLILGLCAIFMPLKINKDIFKKELPIMILSTALLYVFSLDRILSRIDGLVFVVLFIIFCFISFKSARTSEYHQEVAGFKFNKILKGINSKLLIGVFIFVSIILVIWGANLMVKSGVNIAHIFGISPWVIGITVFAVGTSLPELAASMAASVKKVSSIGVGNIVGSNIFNILLVLGAVSLIRPITIDTSSVLVFEMPALLLFNILLVIFMRTSFKISRIEGFILLASYVTFIIVLITK